MDIAEPTRPTAGTMIEGKKEAAYVAIISFYPMCSYKTNNMDITVKSVFMAQL